MTIHSFYGENQQSADQLRERIFALRNNLDKYMGKYNKLILQQIYENEIRDKNPALQDAWEQYQTVRIY